VIYAESSARSGLAPRLLRAQVSVMAGPHVEFSMGAKSPRR
jgi:hypothetical protein